jgi:four helix bundle protein
MVRSYRDLVVWKRAMDAVEVVYRVTKAFPRQETYGLAAQSRRAVVSVVSNIAEGHGRYHLGDYLHHLSMANGSLLELETQLHVARRLDYLTEVDHADALRLTKEVGKMLAGLDRALRAKQRPDR